MFSHTWRLKDMSHWCFSHMLRWDTDQLPILSPTSALQTILLVIRTFAHIHTHTYVRSYIQTLIVNYNRLGYITSHYIALRYITLLHVHTYRDISWDHPSHSSLPNSAWVLAPGGVPQVTHPDRSCSEAREVRPLFMGTEPKTITEALRRISQQQKIFSRSTGAARFEKSEPKQMSNQEFHWCNVNCGFRNHIGLLIIGGTLQIVIQMWLENYRKLVAPQNSDSI